MKIITDTTNDILDLINRQQGKIDYQEAEINLLKDEKTEMSVEIIRQQAEIERLSNSAKQWEETAKDLLIGKEKQQAEIENLKDILYDADGVNLVNYWYQQCEIAENGCRNFEEENENLKAEIERLTINMNAFGLGMKREKERADTIRAEAIKEVAERLKATPMRFLVEYVEYYDKPSINKMVLFIDNNDIDNLVKEMVEK